MKKKWSVIVTGLTALVMLASTAMPAFAQTTESVEAVEVNPKPAIRALGIHAPGAVPAGQEITMTVFERGTHSPVDGAGVWAISWDSGKELRSEVSDIRTSIEIAPEEYDYESLCDLYGEFLGRTDSNGKLNHTFDDAGKYILVTVKNGYYPGFARLTVRNMPKALGIRAPRVAPVNEAVTMTVFERWSHDPIGAAGVWALSRENAETLKKELAEIREDIIAATEANAHESLMNTYGEFLGRTNDEGKLTHVFDQTGHYVLVTWKPGYWPGFAPLNIKAERKALAIRAPRTAFVDQKITMTVYEKPNMIEPGTISIDPAGNTAKHTLSRKFNSNVSSVSAGPMRKSVSADMISKKSVAVQSQSNAEAIEKGPALAISNVIHPVSGAGIWAVPQEKVDVLKKEIEEIQENNDNDAAEYDYESLIRPCGQFLGYTDDRGQLTHAFDAAGKYTLVTWKKGYRPGFTSLAVKASPQFLGLKAPRVAPAGEPVTMKAFERRTGDPVGSADIWAFSWDQRDSMRDAISSIGEVNATGSNEPDIESITRDFGGTYLGQTGNNGELTHTFNDTGRYLLLTIKNGYWPGFATITIKEFPNEGLPNIMHESIE
jgi:hypothetical protein